MERIISKGTDVQRIHKLESWVREHEKVKSKHETYMVVLGILACIAIIIAI